MSHGFNINIDADCTVSGPDFTEPANSTAYARYIAQEHAHRIANENLRMPVHIYKNGNYKSTCCKLYRDDDERWNVKPTIEDARRIWLSVIQRAVLDYTEASLAAPNGGKDKASTLQYEAERFLYSKGAYTNCIEGVCTALDIDADDVRSMMGKVQHKMNNRALK